MLAFLSTFWRDFAIRNCLVSSDLTIKIGDYGISFEKFKVATENVKLYC